MRVTTLETNKDKIQFYNNGTAYPIIKSVGTSLYFKSSSGLWAGRGGINVNYGTNQELADVLGVTLVDISASDTGYIELQDVCSFVFDCITNKPAIKDRTNVKNTDIVLLANVDGKIKGIDTTTFGYPYIEHLLDKLNGATETEAQRAQDAEQQINSRDSFKSKAQFYNNEAAYPIIKKVGTSIYFKSSNGAWAGRGAFNLNYTTDALATAMGVELVDIYGENDRDYGWLDFVFRKTNE
jgi:hypothetical protein